MRTVCVANACMNGKKLADMHARLLFSACRVSSAWMTSLKVLAILKLVWRPAKSNVAFGEKNKGRAD